MSNVIKYRKELKERMIELRNDIKNYKSFGSSYSQYLDNAIDEFTEIETQLKEEQV